MYSDAFINSFAAASRAPVTSLRSDRVLNYVWISKEPGPAKNSEQLCAVPLNYFDKAYHNGLLYPDTQVRVWIEPKFLDASSAYFLKSHFYLNAPANVCLQDLNDIPAYKNSGVFSADSTVDIWNKVDIARFLTVSHSLAEDGCKTAFYADFDLEDVQLDNPVTQERLADMGMAYAELEGGELIIHGIYNTIAHGYIVMDKSRQKYLDEVMIPQLMQAADINFKVASFVFRCVARELFETTGERFNFSKGRIFTDVPIHPCKRNMPAEPLYEELKLCPSFSR